MLLPGWPDVIAMLAVVPSIALAFEPFVNCGVLEEATRSRCRSRREPAGASVTWCVVGSACGSQLYGVPPITRWPL